MVDSQSDIHFEFQEKTQVVDGERILEGVHNLPDLDERLDSVH